jgi:hypothetical protein
MNRNRFTTFALVATVLVVLLAACAPRQSGPAKAEFPVDKGYAEGKEIYFIHTEVSNADLAEKMAAGMESPVFYVPSLANVPMEAQANVYVFTNGVKGASMSGLQPSVFDNPPGTEGYSPLRHLNAVTWADESKARELKSAAEVLAAVKAGELTIKHPGVVINMPFAVWDGGQR